jgi:hypothetical protein
MRDVLIRPKPIEPDPFGCPMNGLLKRRANVLPGLAGSPRGRYCRVPSARSRLVFELIAGQAVPANLRFLYQCDPWV